MLQFKNAEVAEKFTTDYEADPFVHLPGGKLNNGWKGRLSEIPLEQALRWINRPGQNLIKLKEVTIEKPIVEKKVKASDN